MENLLTKIAWVESGHFCFVFWKKKWL